MVSLAQVSTSELARRFAAATIDTIGTREDQVYEILAEISRRDHVTIDTSESAPSNSRTHLHEFATYLRTRSIQQNSLFNRFGTQILALATGPSLDTDFVQEILDAELSWVELRRAKAILETGQSRETISTETVIEHVLLGAVSSLSRPFESFYEHPGMGALMLGIGVGLCALPSVAGFSLGLLSMAFIAGYVFVEHSIKGVEAHQKHNDSQALLELSRASETLFEACFAVATGFAARRGAQWVWTKFKGPVNAEGQHPRFRKDSSEVTLPGRPAGERQRIPTDPASIADTQKIPPVHSPTLPPPPFSPPAQRTSTRPPPPFHPTMNVILNCLRNGAVVAAIRRLEVFTQSMSPEAARGYYTQFTRTLITVLNRLLDERALNRDQTQNLMNNVIKQLVIYWSHADRSGRRILYDDLLALQRRLSESFLTWRH